MAQNKQPYPGAPPKYINDFSKALASEVRILLQEVGKLRDERRALQHEIAELMAVKSKHSAGGEYSPDWHPRSLGFPEPIPEPAPPPPPEPALDGPAKPAWRVVHKRPERMAKGKAKAPAALPAPPPPPPEPPKADLPSWAQWRPNPVYSPQARGGMPGGGQVVQAPPRAGLFGPATPPPQ